MNIKIISEAIKNSYGIVNRVVKNLKSTDGNVYDVFTQDGRYIVKIYNDLKHVNKMIRIVDMLNVNNIKVPNIITNLFNLKYISINNSYLVVYEFLNGKSIINDDITGLISREIIIKIAKEVRKMHDLMIYNDIELEEINFNINLNRKSLLHFDLTKENILNNNGNIEFIDFDDAKYGESVIDISILIALLFFSKKRGVDLKGIQLFIDSYYGYDIELKKLEIKFIKKCALNWIDYTLKNNDLGISINESFETKKKLIKEYL